MMKSISNIYALVMRYLPFTLVTVLFFFVVRLIILSIQQIIYMYQFKGPFTPASHLEEDFSAFDVLHAIWSKFITANPAHVHIGDPEADARFDGSVYHEIIEHIISMGYAALFVVFIYATWFLTTRVKIVFGKYENKLNVWWDAPFPRYLVLTTLHILPILQLFLWCTILIYDHLFPTIYDAIEHYEQYRDDFIPYEPIKNKTLLTYVILTIPIYPMFALCTWIIRMYQKHPKIKDAILEWRFTSRFFTRLFHYQDRNIYPDVVMGYDIETKEPVIHKGLDRNIGLIIVGPPGTGKTSAIIIPMLNQDLGYMVDMINNIDKETDEERANRINGIIVIEPSNDLCKNIYQLAVAKGIPKEAIYYLDPTNEATVSINPLRGPVEKAVETFTMVVQGLAGQQGDFFKQAQRSHLKHYVYLLKLFKGNDATFDDLMEMYYDTRLVADMYEKVRETIPPNFEDASFEELNYHWKQVYGHYYRDIDINLDADTKRKLKEPALRDMRNHWKIVSGVCQWFAIRGLTYMEDRNGQPLEYTEGKHFGRQIVLDKQDEYVAGLKNILGDVAANKLIRRVLFGNSDFDIDTHFKAGGILLVNTALGELSDLSNVLGKFALLLVNNGIFRRDSKGKDPFTDILIDEFPYYIYDSYPSIPAMSRKYKVNIITASQSLSQLSRDFGDDYMYTLLNTFRNKMVYGDVDPKTSEVFSKVFGTVEEYQTSTTIQTVPSMMKNPGRRDGVTLQEKDVERLTPSEIQNLPKFQGAVKLVQDNSTQPVRIVQADFVPQSEYTKPKKKVRPEKAKLWLEYRKRIMEQMNGMVPLQNDTILREGQSNPVDAVPVRLIRELEQSKIAVAASSIDQENIRNVRDTIQTDQKDSLSQSHPAENLQETPIQRTVNIESRYDPLQELFPGFTVTKNEDTITPQTPTKTESIEHEVVNSKAVNANLTQTFEPNQNSPKTYDPIADLFGAHTPQKNESNQQGNNIVSIHVDLSNPVEQKSKEQPVLNFDQVFQELKNTDKEE